MPRQPWRCLRLWRQTLVSKSCRIPCVTGIVLSMSGVTYASFTTEEATQPGGMKERDWAPVRGWRDVTVLYETRTKLIRSEIMSPENNDLLAQPHPQLPGIISTYLWVSCVQTGNWLAKGRNILCVSPMKWVWSWWVVGRALPFLCGSPVDWVWSWLTVGRALTLPVQISCRLSLELMSCG